MTNSSNKDEEIDLIETAASISRNRKIVAICSLSGLLLSGAYAYTKPPVWEGQIQIVLQNKSNLPSRIPGKDLSNPSSLSSLLGAAPVNSSLKTEVKILQSSSVLKPVFDYVKKEKVYLGLDVSGWRYSSWVRSNLNIELQKGTSVLDIFYYDTNKELIVPVLKQITKTYQEYSGRDRKRSLSQAITYLEEQIANMRKESNESMRIAQAFSIKHQLGLKDGLPAASDLMLGAGNSLMAKDSQAKDPQQFDPNTPRRHDRLYEKLTNLESELIQKSALLKPNSEEIISLQTKVDGLRESLSRPKEVLLTHRELLRTALIDEQSLVSLEGQLQATRLDKAKQTTPWELISTPTVLDAPVAPKKSRIIAIGFLAGLVIGIATALIRERKTGLIFTTAELKEKIPYKLLESLGSEPNETWSNAVELLANGPIDTGSNKPIALIPIGNIPQATQEELKRLFKKALNGCELIISKNLLETRKCATQLLIVAPGKVKRSQLEQIKQQLFLQGSPVAGWVLLDPKLEA